MLRADSGDFPGAQDTGACTHRFTGTLENGDIAAFEAIATDNANYAVLCLDSPGGSFGEAVRIARLLSEKNIGTRIEGGAACESACALIFMAGRHVSEQAERAVRWRVLHPRGKLGFHAPALVVPEGNYDKDTVNRAYDVALGTVGSAITELILTGVETSGMTVNLSYAVGRPVPKVEVSAFDAYVMRAIKSLFCGKDSRELRYLNENGVAFNMDYVDPTGETVAKLTVPADFCAQ